MIRQAEIGQRSRTPHPYRLNILPIQQELSKPVNRLCYRIARERDDECEREWHGRG